MRIYRRKKHMGKVTRQRKISLNILYTHKLRDNTHKTEKKENQR